MPVISISLPEKLINKIDEYLELHGFISRSELIREALRTMLSEEEIGETEIVLAVLVVLVKRESAGGEDKILKLIHRFRPLILSFNHLQNDEGCIEIILCKGVKREVSSFILEVRRLRGKMVIRELIMPFSFE